MKTRTQLAIALALTLFVPSCTCNRMARSFGGTQKIELKEGQRVVNCTFKEDDIWVLYRNDTTTPPDTLSFAEHSSYGLLQGTVLLIER